MEPEVSLPCEKEPANFEVLCNIKQVGLLRWEAVSLSPNSKVRLIWKLKF